MPLSPSGLALLRRLASTPGHVVSREELLRVLPGASTDPHTAEVAVARLREALRAATGDDTGDGGLVKTVVRRGLRAGGPLTIGGRPAAARLRAPPTWFWYP